jgi:selenide, water dikinase
VLGLLGSPAMPREVLVSAETGDDAAVYELPDGSALVATVDFFTPIVDDPFDWGRIAAANALSDVYAMGAEPKIALNIAAWPVDDLPLEMLADVLRGGLDVAARAGVALLGGHTITDPEPKYGMVALGFVDPSRLVRNSTARPGDVLVLTKRIGTGMISTAVKRRVATDEQLRGAVDTMTALNADAAEAMRRVGVSAGTDVTGFGLLGHLRKMLEASGVSADVEAGAVPLLPGVLDLARRDVVASGTKRNLAWLNATTEWGELTEPERIVLADAQTSGGLLIATPDPAALVAELDARGVEHAVVGSITSGEPGRIRVGGRVEGSGAG